MWRRIATEYRFRLRQHALHSFVLIALELPAHGQEVSWRRLDNSELVVLAPPKTSIKGAAGNGK
jgi:hypothetical protein